MTMALVPSGKIAELVGLCVIVSGSDKSVAKMKFVPVTSGIVPLQLVPAARARFVKLHKIVGGVVSRTMTARVTVLVLPLPSSAVKVNVFVHTALLLTAPTTVT